MKQRPTGTTAAIGALVVVVAQQLGVNLSAEAAAAIVGGVAAIVSLFTPRS